MTLQPIQTKRHLVLMGMFLSLCLFTSALFSGKILKLSGVNISDESSLFISRVMMWVALSILYVYVIKAEHQKFLLWQPVRNSPGFFIVSFLIIMICIIAGSAILGSAEEYFGINDKSDKLKRLLEVFRHNQLLLLFTILTAAVTEELFFRGYLIPRLQIFFKNAYLPVIVSSLLFGLAHLGFNNIAQVINTVFIGLVCAIYYSKYRNIKVLIVVHFVIDLIGLYSRLYGKS